jgi:hypothetical protein
MIFAFFAGMAKRRQSNFNVSSEGVGNGGTGAFQEQIAAATHRPTDP